MLSLISFARTDDFGNSKPWALIYHQQNVVLGLGLWVHPCRHVNLYSFPVLWYNYIGSKVANLHGSLLWYLWHVEHFQFRAICNTFSPAPLCCKAWTRLSIFPWPVLRCIWAIYFSISSLSRFSSSVSGGMATSTSSIFSSSSGMSASSALSR